MEKPNCQKCRYRIHLARLCDVHVWEEDCDKYGTDFCIKKMNDPEFIKFVDEGGLKMANEKLIAAISNINRQLGVIEGVAFGLPESDQIAVFGAIEAIDEALNEVQNDGK